MPDDQHGRPLHISWSALRAHEECRQKAYLLATKKRASTTDIRGYFHGTVVDRVMNCWLGDNDRQPGEMPGMVEDMIIECQRKALETGDGVVRWRNADDEKEMTEFCKELVTRLEPILYKYVTPYPFEIHKRFKTQVVLPYLDGTPTLVNLVGEMDILVRGHPTLGPDVWVIPDLKGTRDNSYWRKTYGQLVFYDVSLGAMDLLDIEGVAYPRANTNRVMLFQPMCDQRVLEFTVKDTERTELLTRVLRMASDQWAHDKLPKESNKGCSYCDVNHACEKFQRVDVQGRMQLLDEDRQVAALLRLRSGRGEYVCGG